MTTETKTFKSTILDTHWLGNVRAQYSWTRNKLGSIYHKFWWGRNNPRIFGSDEPFSGVYYTGKLVSVKETIETLLVREHQEQNF